ncbi:MAG: AraC family transcriptional regulator [Spirochaetes bacterium]|nr:AraC family transcriptional regulator [Spirochaetota bacterium]
MLLFENIADLHKAQGVPPPDNPLFGLKILKKASRTTPAFRDMELSCNFYFICLKKLKSGNLWYGKTKYDHVHGFMYFLRPNQRYSVHDVKLKEQGFSIEIHEDFLSGTSLFSDIKKYSYFDYETREALHLTPREEKIMWSLFKKMKTESRNNQDEFSKSIILSHLDSMLKYAQRFYARQFIDRKPLSGTTIKKFTECLEAYYVNGEAAKIGIPSVAYMASTLSLSPKYLSDLLKQETGKTALELIHLHTIAEAKNKLAAGDENVSAIAYQLGFENVPYFSKLFRREVGLSPRDYRNRMHN